ncbi:hypothetical protein [Chitinophaga sp. Cy-1792]|uniref:hypothetical protein n=1 Tax=Chitinophaga sp. Cy-1792 TaxID=2608339 RepID=UPI001424905F|nr:hypothetical protein [Chitinophaga sp. Cy-1792]NIG53494.1 hypothetical protein [Chitinophaga sp. Cy-1792]
MKKLCLLAAYVLLSTYSSAQKVISIESYTQPVPEGKKWVIPLNKQLLIAVNPEALNMGNACSASLLTDNPSTGAIYVYTKAYIPDYGYYIMFKGLRSSGFTPNVLAITPTQFKYYNPTEAGKGLQSLNDNLVFYPGEYVGVDECLVSIQAYEYPLNAKELQARKTALNKEAAREAANAAALKAKKASEQAAAAKAAEAERQATLKARKIKEADLKKKYETKLPFDYADVDNDPITELSNKDAFCQEMEEFLHLDKPGNYDIFFTVDLIFDTNGKIISAVNDHSDNVRLLATLQKYYTVTPAEINIDGEKKYVQLKANMRFSRLKTVVKDQVSGSMTATENADNTLSINLYKNAENKKTLNESDTAFVGLLYKEVVKQYTHAKKKEVNNKTIKADRTIYSYLISFNHKYLGTNDIEHTSLSNYSVSKQHGSNAWIGKAALIGADILIK